MKLTLKRLLGMAAVYGIVRYVRSHGGVEGVLDALIAKTKDLGARENADQSVAANNPASEEPVHGSTYASYDLDPDEKRRY